MCGVVAYWGEVPDLILRAAIAGAAARGPHSHGWAFWSGDRWEVQRESGPLSFPPPPLGSPVVGHSRLATAPARHGALPAPEEGQPLITPDHMALVAHNGAAASPVLHAAAEGREPRDSHGLLAIVALNDTGALAGALADIRDPQAVIVADRAQVWAYRHRGRYRPAHPLYLTRWNDGWLLSSTETPDAALLPDGLHLITNPEAS